jgi:hypothetical protein
VPSAIFQDAGRVPSAIFLGGALRRLSILLAVAAMFAAACGDTSIEAASTSTTRPAATTTNTTTSSTTATTTSVPATTTVVDQIAGVWARVPHDETVFGGEGWPTMESVAVGGPGLVAVGYFGPSDDIDAVVWTSPDGVTWSRVPHDETIFGGEGAQYMFSVVAGRPGLVAVGYDSSVGRAAVWTSVDGVTWSRVPHDEMVFGDPPQRMVSVTAGGPGLVAVGEHVSSDGEVNAAVWTSVDGVTWSRVPHDETVFGGDGWQEVQSVTAGGPGLVAVGYAGPGDATYAAVWTSVDGVTWSRVPHDETVFGDYNNLRMHSVTAGGPGVVAVGSDRSGVSQDAAVWTSPDGVTWTRVPHDETIFGGEDHLQTMSSVVATDSGLVAVGCDGWDAAVWTSPDGLAWTQVPNNQTIFGGHSDMHSVVAGGPGLVAVGTDGSNAAVWYWTPNQ